MTPLIEMILISLGIGCVIGVFGGLTISYIFISRRIKKVTKKAVEKILQDKNNYYEGLNYKTHLDVKAEVQEQLAKNGKLDPRDFVESNPPHKPIVAKDVQPEKSEKSSNALRKVVKKKVAHKAPVKPKPSKNGLPLIKLMKKGGK